MVQQTLIPAGHVVLSDASRMQTPERSADHPVDVVILSLYLPNEAGMNAMEEFLYESPGIEIIALAPTSGATKSLTKPVEPRELIKAIEEVLLARRYAELHTPPAAGTAQKKRPRHFNPGHKHGAHSDN